MTIYDSVGMISGVGEVVQGHLLRLGISTINDLLRWFPREYLDASVPTPVTKVPFGRLVAVRVQIKSTTSRRSHARGIPMFEAIVMDDSGDLLVRWFNQPFLKQKLLPGTVWVLIGTVDKFQGKSVMMSPVIEEEPKILSIYGQTRGLTSKMLRGYITAVLKDVPLEDFGVPIEVREREHILPYDQLMQSIHKPMVIDEVERARTGLGFEEAFWFFVRMAASRYDAHAEKGISIKVDVEWLKRVVDGLPFELTPGQKRAIWDSVKDFESGKIMTRLLNGDVGSGKTAVAAVLAAVAAQAGYQSVILVPTEILAKQHSESIAKLVATSGAKVATWTAAQKDDLEKADIIVGTHAVLQTDFSLPRLGFVVVDEQHRFGVRQRHLLRGQKKGTPHLLSMTATPIPRTLALALYGDLTVSLLPDKPKNRLPIITEVLGQSERNRMYELMKQEIDLGHQVFVICPLIQEKPKKKTEPAVGEGEQVSLLSPEEEQAQSKKTVLAEVERLRKEHPEFGRIEAVHGKLKAEDKRNVMDRMAAGEIDVLVATSVIEVGVDVPNATVMLIEGAEHFGLAQLHQFRGRVGRSNLQSYCFLVPTKPIPQVLNRLRVLAQTDSGFEVAEADLQQRGPGELIGQIQSGLPDFRMASLTDIEFLRHAKQVVDEYCENHPDFLQKYTEVAYSKKNRGLE